MIVAGVFRVLMAAMSGALAAAGTMHAYRGELGWAMFACGCTALGLRLAFGRHPTP